MPLLKLNIFSQNAFQLYQELFKIYKQLNSSSSSEKFKCMETQAIDLIARLAFKSNNSDVSLSAIQFLNTHFVQYDVVSSESA